MACASPPLAAFFQYPAAPTRSALQHCSTLTGMKGTATWENLMPCRMNTLQDTYLIYGYTQQEFDLVRNRKQPLMARRAVA